MILCKPLRPFALMVLSLSVPISAEPPAGPLPSFGDEVSVSWVLVPVTVSGWRSEERTVHLEKEDFRLRVDDRPVPFDTLDSDFDQPRTLLFFQDLSGSMANAGKLEAGRRVVKRFLDTARPGDEMSITTFASGNTLVEVPVTPELDVIKEHLETWQPYGTTALHDAVSWIPEIRLTASKVPAVILITDGVDNASVISPDRAREMALQAEVPVYVVALGRGAMSTKSPQAKREAWLYRDLLRRLAETTGGKFVEVRNVDQADRASAIIEQALRSRYVLSFRAAGESAERYHSIRVELPGKRLSLRHRAGYTGGPPKGFAPLILEDSTMRNMIPMTAALLVLTLTSGCVTDKKMKTYVDDQVHTVDSRVDDVETQVEANQSKLAEHERTLEQQQEELNQLSQTSRQALERAVAAGKLAEGKLLYETVLSEADVQFGFESSELSDSAKTALDSFAGDLKTRNESIYLEIQGHTDSLGPDKYNFQLGQERAEAVHKYLHLKHSLPLHRMSVISYGETVPANDGKTREARSENRRVVLVVLK